jgi:protoheme IX farnesyltransferase
LSQTSAIVATRASERRSGSVVRALIETTKPGITRLVTITAMVGFALSALAHEPLSYVSLAVFGIGTLVGTAMSASGANALNQWYEASRDARMKRTCARPIPAGRVPATTILWFGGVLSLLGALILALTCGPIPAGVSLACVISYVLIYTPMKPASAWSTLVGAVPGALPPLIGWTAAAPLSGAGALIEPGGIALVTLMMVWQIPHFMAIAWMYRDDYARGGMRMLPVIDPSGVRTASVVLLTGVLLLLVTVATPLTMPGVLGPVSLAVGAITGLGFLWLCVRLARERTTGAAKRVFFASIIHLPVLLLVMVGEAFVRVTLLS